MSVAGTWKGIFWGTTDTGDALAELNITAEHQLSGRIKLTGAAGMYEADVAGRVDGASIAAQLKNFSSQTVVGLPQSGTFKANFTGAAIEGEWSTNLSGTGKVALRRSSLPTQPVAPQPSPQAPFLFKGTTRQLPIPSCLLNPSDLRKLYNLLEQKASEAAELQVTSLTLQPGQTQEQLEKLKTDVRDVLIPHIVRLQTKSGDWMGGTKQDPLSDDQLPDGITKVEFDSAALHRARFNMAPNNSFLVTIDFSRPDILDMGTQPMANSSVANITANDSNWANGLANALETFFRQTPTKRGWLHAPRSYDVLLLLLGFPLSFYLVFHLDRIIRHRTTLPEALAVTMYVWLVLVVFFCFRVLFNYARWAFPKMEVDAPRQHSRAVAHRLFVSGLTLMVVGALVKAALKLFFGIG